MTALHTRLYPARAELATVGQVWIVESLEERDRHTGVAIREHLLDMFLGRSLDVKVTLRFVKSAAELLAALDELRIDVERTKRYNRNDLYNLREESVATCPYQLHPPLLTN